MSWSAGEIYYFGPAGARASLDVASQWLPVLYVSIVSRRKADRKSITNGLSNKDPKDLRFPRGMDTQRARVGYTGMSGVGRRSVFNILSLNKCELGSTVRVNVSGTGHELGQRELG